MPINKQCSSISNSTETPLVSVIIPAYNHEKYVQETIKSIINQTYENIELIIVDDGSKDKTFEKINELDEACKKRFKRTVFETQTNQGTCLTLNRLLSLSKGEFIYIIASDDISKPDAIETEAKFLLGNPSYSLVVGDNEFIDSEGKRCYWDKNQNILYNPKEAKYLTFAQCLNLNKTRFQEKNFGTYRTLYLDNYIPNGYLIRKSIFDIIGNFTPKAPLEDWWLMLQISKYSKMKFIDRILFSYRWHGANTAQNQEKMMSMADSVRDYEEEILKTIDSKKVFFEVAQIAKEGLKIKSIGLPFVFEICKYKKNRNRITSIKIFNFEIIKYKTKE